MNLIPTCRYTTLGKGIPATLAPPHDSGKRTRPLPLAAVVPGSALALDVCLQFISVGSLFIPLSSIEVRRTASLSNRGRCGLGSRATSLPYHQYDRLDNVVSGDWRNHADCDKCPQPTCVCPSSMDVVSRGMWMWALVTWSHFGLVLSREFLSVVWWWLYSTVNVFFFPNVL